MLCSHVKKFIYLKTAKTAGTSTEIFFERYCCPPEIYQERHQTPEMISQYGVIGYRGKEPGHSKFYNHMPAYLVRDRLGIDIWNDYFKFCVIRNPFDKLVSMFWMALSDEERERLSRSDFGNVVRVFREFSQDYARYPIDRQVYTIGGDVAVDFFIRYEQLLDDIGIVRERLGIDTPTETIGRYKSEYRKRPENFSEYYDSHSEKMVRDFFAWEIERFNYSL